MTVGKDWVGDAAAEIAQRVANTQRPSAWFKTIGDAETWVREIIERHCPFEPDRAYEPSSRQP